MSSFTNLSTRWKLALGFGLMVVLFMVATATAFYGTGAVRNADQIVIDVLTVRNNLNMQRSMLFAIVISEGDGQLEGRIRDLSGITAQDEDFIARLHFLETGDARLDSALDDFVTTRAAYKRTRDEEIFPLMREGKMAEANALVVGVQDERFRKIRISGDEISRKFTARAAAAEQRVQFVCVVSGVIVALAGISMIVGFTRQIAHPLEQITAAADRIARGELHLEFQSSSRTDEVGRLAQSFQRMTRFLKLLAGRAAQIAEGDLTVSVRPQSEHDVVGRAFTAMSENLRRLMKELVDAVNVLAGSSSEIMASTAQLAASAAETATARRLKRPLRWRR